MAAFYNKNLERIRAIEAKVEAGKLDPAKADERIAKLRAVPDYWVKVYDGLKPIRKHVTPPHSLEAAKRLESKLKGQIAARVHLPEDDMKASVSDMVDAYLERMQGKGSFSATRSRANRAKRLIGSLRLEAMHKNPRVLIRHWREDLPKDWSEKSVHLYAQMLQAAVQRHIDTHQGLNIKNPVRTAMKLAELEPNTRRREVFPTLAEYRTILQEARKDTYPAYLAPYLTVLWESGLREAEVLGFRWEKVSLETKREMPWFTVQLRKKRRLVIRQVPMSVACFEAFRALQLSTPGQTETGYVIPVRTHPRKLVDRVLEAVGLSHLWVHDFRRAWRLRHLDKGVELRKEVGGHDTDEMDAYYLILSRQEMESFYREEWSRAKGDM